MNARLLQLKHALGPAGLLSIAMLLAAAAFSVLVVEPLEARSILLKSSLRPPAAQQAGSPADKVEAVYSFLAKEDAPTDALAALHGIGLGTGVRMQSASYRTQQQGRVERFEIALPVAGSYAQIRSFVARALAEIPALSLDQLSLKRESRADGTVQAELRLTIHRVKS